jgi:flap endonuclease-1
MGIRGLNNMLKKYSPESVTENDISKYKNCKVAIDCSILIYKFRYASNAENAHLIGIANRVKFYMMNDILPVFIFDGIPPDAKKITLVKRQNAKYKLYEKLEDLQSTIPKDDEDRRRIDKEIEKISSQLVAVKKEHMDECKELLEKSGVPYFNAPEDAEKYCAFLQKNNYVDYTITDDTDAMTFGCKKILKTNINNKIIEVNLDKILTDFEMSYESFVDFCILSGCDYTDTINKIGPITAFNIIKKNKSIENYLGDRHVENFDYVTCRNIFTNFEYELPTEPFSLKKIDKNSMIFFLNQKNFKENVIKKFIKILI